MRKQQLSDFGTYTICGNTKWQSLDLLQFAETPNGRLWDFYRLQKHQLSDFGPSTDCRNTKWQTLELIQLAEEARISN